MTDDGDLEPRHFFTVTCRRCGKKLQLLGTSKDDLLDRLAASRWEMQPSAAMSDPIDDGEAFLCADCATS